MTGVSVGTLSEFLFSRIAEDEARAQALPPSIIEAAVSYERIHFARWAPSRVLAECAAKRRIVEIHTANGFGWCRDDTSPSPCLTLRALALPYVDHPDYRPEWRP